MTKTLVQVAASQESTTQGLELRSTGKLEWALFPQRCASKTYSVPMDLKGP